MLKYHKNNTTDTSKSTPKTIEEYDSYDDQTPALKPSTTTPDTPSPTSLSTLLPNTTPNYNVIADDMVEQLIKPFKRNNHVYADCKSITGQIHTDQYRPVMIPSSSGMKYLMVLYEFYSNLIWATTIQYKTKLQLVTAYKRLFLLMRRRGLQPQLQRIDNACYKLLKEFLTANNMAYQLKPKIIHSYNYAKKATQNWKDPFLLGMTSNHPDFPQ